MIKERRFTILNVLDCSIDNAWLFIKKWRVWLTYVSAFFFLNAVCGNWSHTCKDSLSISWWCPSSSNFYLAYARMIFYYLAELFLIFSFAFDIYNEAFGSVKSGFGALFKIKKDKLKFVGFAGLLCLVFFGSLFVCVWLIFRKANPNWLIEFGYFLIVFSLATFVVLILRTSASVVLFLENGKIPDFKHIFKLTHGRFYVVLLTFCATTYIISLLQMKSKGLLELWNIQHNYFHIALISEFIGCLIQTFVLMVYVAYFVAEAQCVKSNQQKQIIS